MSDAGVPQDAPMGGRVAADLPGTVQPSVGIDVPKISTASESLAAAGKSLQDGMTAFGTETQKIIDAALTQYATTQGSQSVTRDPTTGQLVAVPKMELGPISKAYNDAQASSYQAQSQTDFSSHAQQTAVQFPNDPEGFKANMDAYTKGVVQNAPAQYRGALLNLAGTETNRYTESLFASKVTADTENASKALQLQFTNAQNDSMALARQGQGASPDGQAAMHTAIDALDHLVANPLFEFSPAEHAQKVQDLTTGVTMEAALGHVLTTAKTQGTQAAVDEAGKVFYDPAIPASIEVRNAYNGEAHRLITEDAAMANQQRSQARAAFDLSFNDSKAAAASGVPLGKLPSYSTLQQVYGDEAPAKYQDLQEAAAQGTTNRVLALAPYTAAANYLASLNPSVRVANALNAATPPNLRLTQAIIGQESGGNPSGRSECRRPSGPWSCGGAP